jgi:tryptophan synthase beta chain
MDDEPMNDSIKFLLDESRIPKSWYNIMADFPQPMAPPLNPATGQPVGPDALAAIFPMTLVEQEMSTERWIEIPSPVREVYRQWRPSPLYRARRLEKALDTPARIYYKNEGVSPAGSHKPNTAVAQAFYNHEAGIRRIATETGAGQWGSSLAFAGSLFGIEIKVFMVRVSFEQKPYRKALMQAYGATCVPSPSDETEIGRKMRELYPGTTGSLGIAISEAVEVAAKDPSTNYALGSVLNHVCLHQTVVGLEALAQFEVANDYPDMVIACAGGGSNLAGIAFPFLGEQLRGGRKVRVIAVEPAACPSLTRGKFAYDFGDTGQFTPLLKMFTLGSSFVPPGFHAGGLRYHAMAPLISHAQSLGLSEARAYRQTACFEAGTLFARVEGIVPAPESTHAVRCAIDEALRCKEEGTSRAILFNLSGHGHFDMSAYTDYFEGKLADAELDNADLNRSLAKLPAVT